MRDKPFKTYQQLVEKLRDEKGLTILKEDEERVISLLKKYSYFSLVSGYKTLFKDQEGKYFQGTRIDDIVALYEFDDQLRDIFFHAIQIVEKHIKSLLSYSFVNKYGEGQDEYLSSLNYDPKVGTKDEYVRQKEIKKLITTFIAAIIPPSEHKYIKHQWDRHKNVPLWATVKVITFGTISKMFSLCEPSVRSDVAKEFPGVSEDALSGMLDMLTRVRNVCAHNERLYDFSLKKSRAIQNFPAHEDLGISKSKSGLYNQGKTDLFAALICLKYLLQTDDFNRTVVSIEKSLETLCTKTKIFQKNKILSCMGFPENWSDIRNL